MFGLISPDDQFTIDGVQMTVAEWDAIVKDGIDSVIGLLNTDQVDQAKSDAEAAKDIADAINSAYGFSIGYWANKGAIDRSDFTVLLIQDDFTSGEFEIDVPFVNDTLVNLGYSVTFSQEADLPPGDPDALAAYFSAFNVVILSNPGFPFDDATTVDALKLAMDQGVGVVLQSDDALDESFRFAAPGALGGFAGPRVAPDACSRLCR